MRVYDVPTCARLAAAFTLLVVLGACHRATAPTASGPDRPAAGSLRAEIAGINDPAGSAASAGGFLPLDIGNHWRYDRLFTVVFIPEGGAPEEPFEYRVQIDRDLVCIEPIGGRDYVVLNETFSDPQQTPLAWRYRQDKTGLYEPDYPLLPPACTAGSGVRRMDAESAIGPYEEGWAALSAGFEDGARKDAFRGAWEQLLRRVSAIRMTSGVERTTLRGGLGEVEPGEITRLAYPIHAGASWMVRTEPFRIESLVERAETLDLAVGRLPSWRIRLENDLLGPEDRVHFWYGRSGLLKSSIHVEFPATDPAGNPGLMIADDNEELVEISLRKGRFASR